MASSHPLDHLGDVNEDSQSLVTSIPGDTFTATDRSKEAVQICQRNAELTEALRQLRSALTVPPFSKVTRHNQQATQIRYGKVQTAAQPPNVVNVTLFSPAVVMLPENPNRVRAKIFLPPSLPASLLLLISTNRTGVPVFFNNLDGTGLPYDAACVAFATGEYGVDGWEIRTTKQILLAFADIAVPVAGAKSISIPYMEEHYAPSVS